MHRNIYSELQKKKKRGKCVLRLSMSVPTISTLIRGWLQTADTKQEETGTSGSVGTDPAVCLRQPAFSFGA